MPARPAGAARSGAAFGASGHRAARPALREQDIQMTISNSDTERVRPVASQISRLGLARRSVRKMVLRYLRWRTVSQLRQLDSHLLRDLGVRPAEFMSVVRGLEIDDARRRNRFP
jgi:uncharacterized protein YjiS (DUF1127 family)